MLYYSVYKVILDYKSLDYVFKPTNRNTTDRKMNIKL